MEIDLIITKISRLREGSFIIEHKDDYNLTVFREKIINKFFQKKYEIDLNFFELSPEKDSQEVKINQIRELKKKFLHKTIYDLPRVVFIRDALALNINSANALLKITEETPQNTFFILMTVNIFKIIPTIRSRSRILKINQEGLKFKSIDEYLIKLKKQFPDIPENIIDDIFSTFFTKKVVSDNLFFETIKYFDKKNIKVLIDLYINLLQYFLKSAINNYTFFKYIIKLHSDFISDIDESINFNTLTSDLLAVYFYRLQSNVVKYGK